MVQEKIHALVKTPDKTGETVRKNCGRSDKGFHLIVEEEWKVSSVENSPLKDAIMSLELFYRSFIKLIYPYYSASKYLIISVISFFSLTFFQSQSTAFIDP